MRAFIAVDFPDELKPKIEKLQDRIDMAHADIKFVEPENLHYNLKFLGEITEEDAEKVKTVLDEIAGQFEAFRLHVAGLGAFPSTQYIRVVWIGAKEGSQILKAIAEQIELKLGEMGFRKEPKAYTPHLTLGRVRTARNKPELQVLLRELENTDIGAFVIKEIRLMESKLGPKGPVYRPIHIAKLKGTV